MVPQCGELVDVKSTIGRASQRLNSQAPLANADETALVGLTYASGATAEMMCSVVLRAPRQIELYGTNGTIVCNETLGARGAGAITVNGDALSFNVESPYSNELADFFSAIVSAKTASVGGAIGAANVALLERITGSATATPVETAEQLVQDTTEGPMTNSQKAGEASASKKPARTGYRGKHFTIPVFTAEGGVRFDGSAELNQVAVPQDSPIIQCLNQPFDRAHFKTPRRPVSLGLLTPAQLRVLRTKGDAQRTLDMPIKFPGSDFRLPKELARYAEIIKRVANFERAANPHCFDEYYCYLTVDMGYVEPGQLQREAPCHVDGFQGARWTPKVRGNHTYTVSNAVPTAYYMQPFDLDALDEAQHDFFWEMNRQVAETGEQFAWHAQDGEITLMDCYTVHRGTQASKRIFRTFVRISFEVRIFDRLGNAHNPMFSYDWPMVKRDIEALNLVAFDPNCDPSLRVFPWQALDGSPLNGGPKTQPKLRPASSSGKSEEQLVAQPELPAGKI